MAIALAKTLKQTNAEFLAKLTPNMKVIADDAFKRVSDTPVLEWEREYERGLSSGWSSSSDTLVLKNQVDLSASVAAAIREVIGKDDAKAEPFFNDAVHLLRVHFDTLFYKSGFQFRVFPSETRSCEGDGANLVIAAYVTLHVTLNVA
jgi:hypothetical protein